MTLNKTIMTDCVHGVTARGAGLVERLSIESVAKHAVALMLVAGYTAWLVKFAGAIKAQASNKGRVGVASHSTLLPCTSASVHLRLCASVHPCVCASMHMYIHCDDQQLHVSWEMTHN